MGLYLFRTYALVIVLDELGVDKRAELISISVGD